VKNKSIIKMLGINNFYWKESIYKETPFDISLYYEYNRFEKPIATIQKDGVYICSDKSKLNLCIILDKNLRYEIDSIAKPIHFWEEEDFNFFSSKDLEIAKLKIWVLITDKIKRKLLKEGVV